MPPRKRSAAAGATTSTAKRAKVSIGGVSVMGEPDPAETHASGRPKRSGTGEATDRTTAANTAATKTATAAPATALARRGRGRPRKDTTTTTAQKEEQPASTTPPKSPRKTAGRPKKPASAKFTRVKSHAPVVPRAEHAEDGATPSPQPAAAPIPKSRGRPKRTTTKAAAAAAPAATPADEPKGSNPATTQAKEKAAEPPAESHEDVDGLTANESEWDESHKDDGKQYWLMKAEPDSRLENGVDVKFSIDDLMNANEPEGWDGVRNAVARNRMRAMRKGDWAFFYHSNTKVPGVAGIMEIVQEHSLDESAFNPASPYYDPKSTRDKPKWELVHVQFVRKFPALIPLSELRKHGQPGGALQDLEMLKQSRLSVSAVRSREWHFIVSLAQDEGLDHHEPDEDQAPVRGPVRAVNGGISVNGVGVDGGDEAVKSKITVTSSVGELGADPDA